MLVKLLSDILSTVNIKVDVKTPPELSEQFPYIRQLLDAYHIKHYELENYEADDIIGTLSRELIRLVSKRLLLQGIEI